jgi:hypothetical protein
VKLPDLIPAEMTVPVLEIHSDLGHMEIITSGTVLPVLLHRSARKPVKAPPGLVKRKKSEAAAE